MICAIVILFLGTTTANQCNTICTSTYITWNDVKPMGCDQTTMWTTACKSKLSCASACASNKTCAAFLYASKTGTCSLCYGDLIQSLNFTSGETFSWPHQVKEKWPLTDAVAKTTTQTVPIKVTLGIVLHLQGYYYSFRGFAIDFRQDFQGKNITFHFSATRNGSRISVPEIILSYKENNVWGSETRPAVTPYPFVENTVTNVDILVAKNAYQIYIDQNFCFSYNHVMPYENTQYLLINGSIEVYELRV